MLSSPSYIFINHRTASQHSHGISGPFQTGLSEGKKIQAWLDATHVNIRPKRHNVILQLRSAAGALNLTARFTEQCNIVAALFTSDWQLQNQVFGRATDFERAADWSELDFAREPQRAHGDPKPQFRVAAPDDESAPTAIPPPRKLEPQPRQSKPACDAVGSRLPYAAR